MVPLQRTILIRGSWKSLVKLTNFCRGLLRILHEFVVALDLCFFMWGGGFEASGAVKFLCLWAGSTEGLLFPPSICFINTIFLIKCRTYEQTSWWIACSKCCVLTMARIFPALFAAQYGVTISTLDSQASTLWNINKAYCK